MLKRHWQNATQALVSGLEARNLQRHRTMAALPAEGVILLNLGSLALLLAASSL